jgi:predicted transcriptional regulator with HTH domain
MMPRISQVKKERIQEQILQFLYQIFPKQIFTSDIAVEIARDEEFIKTLLLDLEKKELIIRVNKNSDGINYLRRQRWRLSNKVHELYSQKINQKTSVQQIIEHENSENIS